jgi:hypothetical protein
MVREALGDQRNGGATTHDRDRDECVPGNPVAFQQVLQRGDDIPQWSLDYILEFGSGQTAVGSVRREFDEELGGRLGRQSLLGLTALFA